MRARPRKDLKILNRILLPTTIIMVIQIALIVIIITTGPTRKKLNEKTAASFKDNVDLRSDYFQNYMVNVWGDLEENSILINNTISDYITSTNITISQMKNNSVTSRTALYSISENMISILRKNLVTDAFIVIDNNEDAKQAIYIRDRNPEKIYSNNMDVIIEVSPSAVRDKYIDLDCDLSTESEIEIDMSKLKNRDFFYKPIQTQNARSTIVDTRFCGYWSTCSMIHNNPEKQAITYSIPLSIDGVCYGVLGIGLSYDYLNSLVRSLYSENKYVSNYTIVKKNSEGTIEPVIKSFSEKKLNQYFNYEYYLDKDELYKTKINKEDFYLCESNLGLYSTTNNFYNEDWYIIGIVDSYSLYGTNQEIIFSIIFIAVLALIFEIGVEILLSYKITKPITKLSNKIKETKTNNKEFIVERTNIREINVLLDRISEYTEQYLELPTRLNRIMTLADVELGAFEYDLDKKVVLVTSRFFELFQINDQRDEIDSEEFEENMTKIRKNYKYKNNNEEIFYFEDTDKWVGLRTVKQEKLIIGIVRDLTNTIKEKQKLEFERDRDILTGLLNRRGFESRIKNVLNKKELCLIMMDLDKLKKVNDAYGHDFGDLYIKETSNIIEKFSDENSLVCHLSGDEFVICLYNRKSIEDLRKDVSKIEEAINKGIIRIYGEVMNISLSAGVAFMDETVDSYEELRRRADFAMYDVKSSKRSEFNYFDIEKYNNNKEKLYNVELLNKLITNKSLDYYYQPIVSTKNAKIIGYEALMRPKAVEISNPEVVLRLARENNKLGEIEAITMFEATGKFAKYNSDKLLFINSISNQILSDENTKLFEEKYKNILPNLVIEFTEEEMSVKEVLDKKIKKFNDWKCKFAIDDYGTGYNNLSSITRYSPDFVKIEGSLVKDIDSDQKKYELTKGIVDYCKKYNIAIIAESVETKEELEVIISLGIEYVQGYFLARPNDKLVGISEESIKVIKNFKK